MKLNGAELPCGSIISVERADMNYKENINEQEKKKKDLELLTKHGNNYCERGTKGEQVNDSVPKSTKHKDEGTIVDNEDDDLDDFFASL